MRSSSILRLTESFLHGTHCKRLSPLRWPESARFTYVANSRSACLCEGCSLTGHSALEPPSEPGHVGHVKCTGRNESACLAQTGAVENAHAACRSPRAIVSLVRRWDPLLEAVRFFLFPSALFDQALFRPNTLVLPLVGADSFIHPFIRADSVFHPLVAADSFFHAVRAFVVTDSCLNAMAFLLRRRNRIWGGGYCVRHGFRRRNSRSCGSRSDCTWTLCGQHAGRAVTSECAKLGAVVSRPDMLIIIWAKHAAPYEYQVYVDRILSKILLPMYS